MNDTPAGDTGGLSELPEKMRVHALAKLLGTASRDVLAALSGLGQEVRSVQSSITRATAEQVVAALRPGTEPAAASADRAPEPAVTDAPDPVVTEVLAALDLGAGSATDRDSATDSGTDADADAGPEVAADPADPFTTGSARARGAAAPALAPVFAVPMFQAPAAPGAAPAATPEPAWGRDTAAEQAEDGPGDGAPRKGRKGRRRKDRDAAATDAAVTDGTAGTGSADSTGDAGDPVRVDVPAGDSADDRAEDRPDSDDDGDDENGNRRRRRRGRRGRGRGKGGEDFGEDGGDDSDDSEDPGSEDSGADSGSTGAGSEDSDSSDDSDDSEDQSSGGSRRRRRRRRRGGSEVEDRSEDDPPNTVTRVREARSESRQDSGSSSDDQVQGVRGSTRLEAKRQRRREGRDAGRRRPPILSESEFLARRESVDRQMVIRQRADRTEIGVLEDGILVEHFITGGNSGSSMVGNVYLGRVQNVLPSMEAAFVDIGRGRNAVLYAGEVDWDAAGLNGKARKIEQALSSGDQVLVQVTKDPVGHKGARLTTQLSLAGRFLVYVPSGGAAGISRKLPDTERKRLKEMLKEIVPADAGVIIRTASEGVSHEALERDVRRLQAQWEVVKEKANKTGPGAPKAPTLLYEEPDMLVKVVRDQFNEDFSKLIVSGADAWDTVSGYVEHVAPELADRMHRHTGPSDVFTEYRIDEQLLKALDRKVWLPSGGTLVIDRTEAMTVVDVNTGKFTGSGGNLEETVTRNNLEAAEEVVRQLRLRDIGGIIVVDFIDMVLEANRDLVLRRLTECLARDRTRHQVAEVTSLGLVQMTRKRVGGGLLEHFSTTCEHCRGRGVIVSTDTGPDHQHGRSGNGAQHGNGSGNGNGNGNGSGNGHGGSGNGGHADSEGGGRRKRRRGGNGNGDSGQNEPGDGDSGRQEADRNGSGHRNGSDRPDGRSEGRDRARDDSGDTGRVDAAAAVAAVAAGSTPKGDDGATAGATGVSVPATADTATTVDAAPAPAPADDETVVAEPRGELTGSPAPVVAEPTGAPQAAAPARDVAPEPTATSPAPEPDAPAPRRRRASRSAGPVRGGEPVVITTASTPEESTPPAATATPADAGTAAVPAVAAQPEPAAVVTRTRRSRRAASRPAGPPQDGG
ncbi:translation initiation factor IF-2 N-terminal domain-containing protein [Pseudonocardia sp. HH130629-09]|uniref:translation initiation factor IF-2 N-terminal domain-containing protein n=1 Tax=Pseudonocardia sp. HH130629-09 TaxID=1641402 RepID=UPI001EE72690|nr:translation initiation factor IF-2 N-terminal domain-containing protein [Pseudonocardia sp. HH130629-09]